MSQNTYHTLQDMRIVFVDGSVLDTGDPVSCAAFMQVGGGGGRGAVWVCTGFGGWVDGGWVGGARVGM